MIIFLTHQSYNIHFLSFFFLLHISVNRLLNFLFLNVCLFWLIFIPILYFFALFCCNFLYMFSKFNSLSFMGMSDCGLFFSGKDLDAAMEFNSLSRPTLEFQDECQIAPSSGDDRQPKQQEKKFEVLDSSSPRIKTPPLAELKGFDVEDEDDEGCRTPTSSDTRIPLIPQCPPAPRKRKSTPSNKRKAASSSSRRILSSEVESLFPSHILADLDGKIKKVRKVMCDTK